LLLSAAPAVAFDFVVTRYDDPVADGCLAADCSLREAVIAANAANDADRILLSAGVYAISLVGSGENLSATGDLNLKKNLEIVGVGAGITILDAAGLGEAPIFANDSSGTFALRRLTVRNSDFDGVGLGLGTHVVEDCEIRSNGINGIATSIESNVTLRRVSVVDNSSTGLRAQQGSTTVENSTFSGNGGVEIAVNLTAAFSCTHCTIHDPADAGAEVAFLNATVTFSNSIVAGECSFNASTLTSLGGNVESSGHTCGFSQASDQDDVSAGALALGVLADNGGQTLTHLPGAASVANGSANDALCLAEDQRGVVRETNCESGAVERTNVAVPTPIFIDGFLQGDSEAWSATVN
jgi:CSLREA domain-containing protein